MMNREDEPAVQQKQLPPRPALELNLCREVPNQRRRIHRHPGSGSERPFRGWTSPQPRRWRSSCRRRSSGRSDRKRFRASSCNPKGPGIKGRSMRIASNGSPPSSRIAALSRIAFVAELARVPTSPAVDRNSGEFRSKVTRGTMALAPPRSPIESDRTWTQEASPAKKAGRQRAPVSRHIRQRLPPCYRRYNRQT